MRKVLLITAALGLLIAVSSDLIAAPFYKDKTLRVTVGFSAGGGFDLWARTVARHIGKHIEGNPTVIVENVTGAGGLIQTNNLFSATKPDGLTIGHINGGLILSQMLGQPGYDFDSQKFIYIGSANKENTVFCLSKKSGINSVAKWRTAASPVKLGGMVPGNFADNMERLMKEVIGYPTQVISGYKGTADIRIAAESGELAGGAVPWDTVKTTWKRSVDAGDMVVILQAVPKPLKQLPKIPKLINLAKTQEQKNLIQIVAHYANDFSRPYAVPPGTPKERVDILRKAFQETMKDKEFIAEVNKMQLTLDPMTGENLTAAVAASAAKLDPSLKEKLKNILFK